MWIITSTSKNLSVEDAVPYLLAYNDSDLSNSKFEPSDDLSDENGKNENENMNENMRKRIRRGWGNAVLRRTRRIRTRGERINNSIGVEERDKILEKSWCKVDREPQVHNFNGQPILKVPFNKSNARILDYFKLFATSDFHLMISDQKNLYVEQYQLNSDDKSSSSWTPTTATENGHFLALHFLTEIVQKSLIRQYWSTGPLLQTSVFYQVITRSRFEKILQFLNFADNSKYDTTDLGRDKLFKVRDILDFLVDCFKTVYIPSENISINEKLLLYKGRLLFKQYVPSKRAGFGIKLFSLCEDSGYLWNSFLYLGKTTIMKINTS